MGTIAHMYWNWEKIEYLIITIGVIFTEICMFLFENIYIYITTQYLTYNQILDMHTYIYPMLSTIEHIINLSENISKKSNAIGNDQGDERHIIYKIILNNQS